MEYIDYYLLHNLQTVLYDGVDGNGGTVHLDIFGGLPDEKLILDDGTDVTEEVLTAERWLIEHSF